MKTHRFIHHMLVLAAAALLPIAASAAPPEMLHYQGRVLSGAAPFTGTGQFKFALVNAAGSQTFWSNDGTSAAGSQPAASVGLNVAAGLYAARLGDTALAGMTQPVPPSVFAANSDVRLRVWFNDGTNGFQQLAPDARLTSVGFAMNAASATTAAGVTGNVSASQISGGTLSAAVIGNASISSAKLAPGAAAANLNDSSAVVIGGITPPAGARLAVGEPPEAIQIFASQNVHNGGYSVPNHWQSFTAPEDLLLTDVELYKGDAATGTLKIYAGEGTGGAVLHSEPITMSPTVGYHRATLTTPVRLTGGSVYTFGYSGSSLGLVYQTGDPFSGGRSSVGSSFDFRFRLYGAPPLSLFAVTDTGRVGIGTDSPTEELDVIGDIRASGSLSASSVSTTGALSAGALTAASVSTTGALSAASVSTTGAVAAGSLNVSGDYIGRGHLLLHAYEGKGMGGIAYVQARDDTAPDGNLWLQFRTQSVGNVVDTMRLHPSGRVGIGFTSAPLFLLHVNGSVGATAYLTTSDGRLKKNVQPVAGALEKVRQMRGVRYDWRSDEFPDMGLDAQPQVGFIAQELKAALPEAVTLGEDGFHRVDYAKVTPVLVEAMKEQQSTIEAQAAEIAALKARLDAIEQRLSATAAK